MFRCGDLVLNQDKKLIMLFCSKARMTWYIESYVAEHICDEHDVHVFRDVGLADSWVVSTANKHLSNQKCSVLTRLPKRRTGP